MLSDGGCIFGGKGGGDSLSGCTVYECTGLKCKLTR